MDYIDRIVDMYGDRPDIIESFKNVDRSMFLPESSKKYADYDMPLPIGYGQTTSQPSLIADMIYLIDIKKGDKVLEIGTGTGFASAVMANLGVDLYTVERVRQLYEIAKKNLSAYPNVKVFLAEEGVLGLPQYVPFDKIIVFAHADEIPQELVDQLSVNGMMIIPVGDEYLQYLYRVTKRIDGDEVERLYPVRFVPIR